METLRLSLFALALFALAFVGISWAAKGFPLMGVRAVAMKPDARVPTFEESVQQGIRKDWENAKTSQSDGNKERDRLRAALRQAAVGYKLSPCDKTMKKNLVAALTDYMTAWYVMAGCKGDFCLDDKKLDAAAAAFQTPADISVHQELHEAWEQGGITRDDFPKPIRTYALTFVGKHMGDSEAACFADRKQETMSR